MIVSKFSGTSVGDAAAIRRVAAVIQNQLDDRPVVVVSALAGVTDALLAIEGNPCPAGALAAIGARHRRIADDLGLVPADFDRIATDLATLTRWLSARQRDSWTAADRDRIVSHGELWSSRLVVAALRAAGVPSDWVDARHFMITDDRFAEALPDRLELVRRSARFLGPLLASGRVPVTQGFIGTTPDGRTTTLGRGGSDYTASLLGAVLGVRRVELWSDVDGIMTADPLIVPDARLLPEATYEEAADLAAFGARVPHPTAYAPLIDVRIPCLVKNSLVPDRPGTRIGAKAVDRPDEHGIRSVALRRGIAILSLRGAHDAPAADFLQGLVGVFARHGVRANVLASSDRSASVTVDERECGAGLTADLERLGRVARRDGRALVAMVGIGLQNVRGLANRLFNAVGQVDTEVISQGASETNVTLVVRDADAPEVVRRLHAEFLEPAVEGVGTAAAVYLAD